MPLAAASRRSATTARAASRRRPCTRPAGACLHQQPLGRFVHLLQHRRFVRRLQLERALRPAQHARHRLARADVELVLDVAEVDLALAEEDLPGVPVGNGSPARPICGWSTAAAAGRAAGSPRCCPPSTSVPPMALVRRDRHLRARLGRGLLAGRWAPSTKTSLMIDVPIRMRSPSFRWAFRISRR